MGSRIAAPATCLPDGKTHGWHELVPSQIFQLTMFLKIGLNHPKSQNPPEHHLDQVCACPAEAKPDVTLHSYPMNFGSDAPNSPIQKETHIIPTSARVSPNHILQSPGTLDENATFSGIPGSPIPKHIHRSLITRASATTPAAAKLNALSPKGAGPVSRFQCVRKMLLRAYGRGLKTARELDHIGLLNCGGT